VNPKQVIGRTLDLDSGDSIVLSFSEVDIAESFRAQLYKHKRELAKISPDLANSIVINRSYSRDNITITVKKATCFTATLITGNGEVMECE
jgi:ATP-dependent protease HslVU (ClpYQ) peptidase subunit